MKISWVSTVFGYVHQREAIAAEALAKEFGEVAVAVRDMSGALFLVT